MPGTCQVGRFVRRSGRPSCTSDVEVGQTTYPVNREIAGREEREGSEGQSHKEEKGKEGVQTVEGQGTLSKGAKEGGLYLDICAIQRRRAIEALEARAPGLRQHCDCGY